MLLGSIALTLVTIMRVEKEKALRQRLQMSCIIAKAGMIIGIE